MLIEIDHPPDATMVLVHFIGRVYREFPVIVASICVGVFTIDDAYRTDISVATPLVI